MGLNAPHTGRLCGFAAAARGHSLTPAAPVPQRCKGAARAPQAALYPGTGLPRSVPLTLGLGGSRASVHPFPRCRERERERRIPPRTSPLPPARSLSKRSSVVTCCCPPGTMPSPTQLLQLGLFMKRLAWLLLCSGQRCVVVRGSSRLCA